MMEFIKFLAAGTQGDRWVAFIVTLMVLFAGLSILIYWVGDAIETVILAWKRK